MIILFGTRFAKLSLSATTVLLFSPSTVHHMEHTGCTHILCSNEFSLSHSFSKDMSLSLHKNNTICFTHTHTHSLKRIVLKIYISIWISKSFLTNHFFCNVICDYMFGAPLRLWPACRRARRVRLTFWWPCTKTEKATTIKYRRTQLPFGGTQMGSLFLPNFMVIP